jgi:hypothetical protein
MHAVKVKAVLINQKQQFEGIQLSEDENREQLIVLSN